MNAVDALIDLACSTPTFPAATQAAAVRLLRDTLSVGIAGSGAPGAAGVRATAASLGHGADARVLGCAMALPAASAAFANGFQIHCLEWDAVHEGAVVHALSVVTSAIMAVAQRQGDVTPNAFIASLIIGVDIASGLGLASTGALRFFRPATAGILGATLAAGRLAKLSASDMRNALGLAYAQASGTMQAHVEGSIALPLQIGFAARGAVTAVDLARHGLTGPHDSLEGPYGYFQLFETDADLPRYFSNIGGHWHIDDISIKPYPTGRAAHATLSALAHLQHTHEFRMADIASIHAGLTPLACRLVGRPIMAGMTPAYARLCLPYLAGLMLRDSTIDPQHFSATVYPDAELLALGSKLSVRADDNPDTNALSPQRVSVVLHTGAAWTLDIAHTLGSPANPLSTEQLTAKFDLCCAGATKPLGDSAQALLRTDPVGFVLS